jgi:pyruvate carboxylase
VTGPSRSAPGPWRIGIPAEPPAELTGDDRDGLDKEPQPTTNRLLLPAPTREFTPGVHGQVADGDRSQLTVEGAHDGAHAALVGLRHRLDAHEQPDAGFEVDGVLDARVQVIEGLLGGEHGDVAALFAVGVKAAEKADRADPGQVVAPFAGVVTLTVAEGGTVETGQSNATIEAMNMEAALTTPRAGTVARTAIGAVQQVEGGDLLLVIA